MVRYRLFDSLHSAAGERDARRARRLITALATLSAVARTRYLLGPSLSSVAYRGGSGGGGTGSSGGRGRNSRGRARDTGERTSRTVSACDGGADARTSTTTTTVTNMLHSLDTLAGKISPGGGNGGQTSPSQSSLDGNANRVHPYSKQSTGST